MLGISLSIQKKMKFVLVLVVLSTSLLFEKAWTAKVSGSCKETGCADGDVCELDVTENGEDTFHCVAAKPRCIRVCVPRKGCAMECKRN